MNVFQATAFGVIQGLTEFFPVSSSGHLILLPRLFGWEEHSLAFDAILHLGTGLAVLVYFRKEWLEMICGFTSDILNIKVLDTFLTNRHSESRPVGTKNLIGRNSKKRDSSVAALPQNDKKYLKFSAGSRRLVLIVLATVPAGIAGLLLNDFVEANLRSPQVVAGALIIVAVLMLLAERVRSERLLSRHSEARGRRISITKGSFADAQDDGGGQEGGISLVDVSAIGLSQVLALIPGISRSGITMTAGLFRGLDRESAARFSFLLATPIVLGAGIWGIFEAGQLTISNQQLTIGFFFSFLSGLLAIKLFLKLLTRWGLVPFAVYRILLSFFIFTFL